MSSEVLEKKEYLVGITIIEGRNIIGKDSGGTSDPFLKVRCADQVQQSQKKYEQNSAVWNQSLTFSGLHMNQNELETFEIILELYDHNAVFRNALIGLYSIGLSTLYRALNHEFYKTWVGVFHPDEPDMVTGYLQISCFIVGPNERPPCHGDDEGGGEYVEMSEEEIENIKRAQGLMLINQPDFIVKSYQLTMVVMKAEGLPQCDLGMVNGFISCRVNGCVTTTKIISNNKCPVFQNKLLLPVTTPILNDKITVRIWSQNSGLSANTFIANVPEHPSEYDYFNLSKIIAQDGRMSPKWIHLYGVLPADRNAKTKGRKEGSSYLGRILISFSMIPSDRPQLMTQASQVLKEPKQKSFQLWVDLYEWINCKLADKTLNFWVVITQGDDKSLPVKARVRDANKEGGTQRGPKQYILTFPVKAVPALIGDFPQDFQQIPDVFINFFCNMGDDPKDRIGYIRIKAKEVSKRVSNPQWYRIKTPQNENLGNKLGQILMNVQFIPNDPVFNMQCPRQQREKSGKQQYKFYYQILNAFELASSKKEGELNTYVDIVIGNQTTGKLKSDFKKGHYPIWNNIGECDVQMEKDLSFETDMRITIYNKTKSMFGVNQGHAVLGEFCVVISSLQNQCEKPQFFNVINENGQFIGQILANFYLKFYPKDPKNKNKKDFQEPEHLKLVKKFRSITKTEYEDINLSVSLVGVRNLVNKAKNAQITLKLTNSDYNKVQWLIPKDSDKLNPPGKESFWHGDFESKGVEVSKIQIMTPAYLTNFEKSSKIFIGTKHIATLPEDIEASKLYKFDVDNCSLLPAIGDYLRIISPNNKQPKFEKVQVYEDNVIKIPSNEEMKEMALNPMPGNNGPVTTYNPTFQKKVTFSNINLTAEPLLWPFLVVKITEYQSEGMMGNFLGSKGCEDCFTTMPLIDYGLDMGLIEFNDFTYCQQQFSLNQDSIQFVQSQIDIKTFFRQRGVYIDEEDLDAQNADSPGMPTEGERGTFLLGTPGGDPRGTDLPRATVGGTMLKQIGYDIRGTIARGDAANEQEVTNIFKLVEKDENEYKRFFKDENDKDEEYSLGTLRSMGGGADQTMEFGEEDALNDENPGAKVAGEGQNDDLETGIIVGVSRHISKEFIVKTETKQKEDKERESRKHHLDIQVKGYQKKLLGMSDEQVDQQRKIKMKIMELNEEMGELDDEKMTLQKFWGMALDEDDEFDYGRDFHKDGNYDEKLQSNQLPYEIIPLFLYPDWQSNESQKQFVQVGGITRSGLISGAYIKAKVSIEEDESDGDDDDDSDSDAEEKKNEDGDAEGEANAKKKKKKGGKDKEDDKPGGGGSEKAEKIDKAMFRIRDDCPFKLEEPEYMQALMDDSQNHFKIRVYILSCQNLSAMNSVIDIKSRLAGMNAMCTANPYPVITIGDGENSNKMFKKKNDRESVINEDLNPEFLKTYELDARMPEDWKLEIALWDKTNIESLDQLIGTTVIDLENRRHSDLLLQNIKACELEQINLNKKYKLLGEEKGRDKKAKMKKMNQMKKLQQKRDKVKKMIDECKRIEQILVPIEFRELTHPKKNQTQGMCQVFTEILTIDDSRKIPISKIKSVFQETFEIRIVIWDCRDIPLVDGGAVDIFIKCTFDPSGWSKDEITKCTDTHMNSQDGKGQFNWRMKFDLKVPCEFPRLKFQVLDAGVVADEAIGETTMNLKGTIKNLKKEESVSIPKSFLTFLSPTNPDEEKGFMMFSMDIMRKEDANQDPVGEAQNEPNKNPFLKAPTAGRGLGDALAAIGIPSISLDWNPFGKFLYFVIAAGVMGTILTFSVMLK